jgi:MFS transporter, MHS family, proline/betaine transporter
MSGLNKEQKQAVGLLSIGTFLEYFDLMLYVHMAVLLNELFFPKTDPHTAALLSAFAFCSTYVFRPIGAFIFGYIGDNIGRKSTVIITTMMMALSCFIMANLPTYAQIGITAAWLVTICRIVQGMTSMGEIVGAEIYLIEATKPPVQYPTVALISFFSVAGGCAALGMASLVTSYGFNWRMAFWVGAGIALVGSLARTALRETPDFVDAKRKLAKVFEDTGIDKNKLEDKPPIKMKVNRKTTLCLFLMQCSSPICFYLAYIHCGNILKNSFGYTAEQIIHQNFIVSIVQCLGLLSLTYLSSRIYPLRILKIKMLIFFIFTFICPYLLYHISSPFHLLLIQSFVVLFTNSTVPAIPILYSHFPIFKRFTYTSVVYAISRAFMYVITSFGVVYLTEYFNHTGLLFIMLPAAIGFVFGIYHFEKLEKAGGNYPQKIGNLEFEKSFV